MKPLTQFSRGEQITGVAGILLLIGIFAFPWYHISVPGVTFGGTSYGGGSYDGNVLQGPGSFFSYLAMIVLIALLAELVISRFTTAKLPDLPISWAAFEVSGAVAVLALLIIKLLFHIGNLGWGFYANLVLAIALVYGATGLLRHRPEDVPAHAAPQHIA